MVLSFGYYFIIPQLLGHNGKVLYGAKEGIVFWDYWNLFPSLNIFLGVLLIHHLVEYTDDLKRWLGVVKTMCYLCFGVSIYAIIQFLGYDQIFPFIQVNEGSGQIYHMFTFMGNKMLSNNLIACLTPLFLIFREKKFYAMFAVSCISLIVFKSAFNLGVCFAGVMIILFLQGNWRACILLMIVFLICMFVFRSELNTMWQINNHYNGRLNYMHQTLKMFTKKIFTGHGVGFIPHTFAAENVPTRWHSSHNMAVDILCETGLIGFSLLLLYLINLFKRVVIFITNGNNSMLFIGLIGALISWLLMSMGSFPHRIAPLALIGLLYITGIEAHLAQKRRI